MAAETEKSLGMTDVTESSSQGTGRELPISHSIGGELPIVQAAYRLNGKNYLKWSQLIKTFLKGKGKLSHLEGSGPQENDPMYGAWDEEDSLIMSWLWNSMNPEISDTVMFLTTAREIWEAVKITYSKVRDAAQIYELRIKAAATKQGNRSITECSNLLQTLWQ